MESDELIETTGQQWEYSLPDDAFIAPDGSMLTPTQFLYYHNAQQERIEAAEAMLAFAGIPDSWFEPYQSSDGDMVETKPGNFCGHEPRCMTIWQHVEATTAAKHVRAITAESKVKALEAALRARCPNCVARIPFRPRQVLVGGHVIESYHQEAKGKPWLRCYLKDSERALLSPSEAK